MCTFPPSTHMLLKSAIDEILNIHVTIDVSVASGEYIDADRFIHVVEDTYDLEKLNNYKSVLLSDISNMYHLFHNWYAVHLCIYD